MAGERRLVTAGRVGRTHGLDGSFHVLDPANPLERGTEVVVAGAERSVARRAGTDDRPLIRLAGVESREAARALGGELLLVREELGEGEWLADDLIGLEVAGIGRVERVIGAPSCDVLELDDGTLIPLIADAVTAVDLAAGRIDVDRAFLRLEGPPG